MSNPGYRSWVEVKPFTHKSESKSLIDNLDLVRYIPPTHGLPSRKFTFFPFMQLPPELRLEIYSLAGFFKPHVISLCSRRIGSPDSIKPKNSSTPPVARLIRRGKTTVEFQICRETRMFAMEYYQKVQHTFYRDGLSVEGHIYVNPGIPHLEVDLKFNPNLWRTMSSIVSTLQASWKKEDLSRLRIVISNTPLIKFAEIRSANHYYQHKDVMWGIGSLIVELGVDQVVLLPTYDLNADGPYYEDELVRAVDSKYMYEKERTIQWFREIRISEITRIWDKNGLVFTRRTADYPVPTQPRP
jgi:hypothetical protein